MTVLRHLVIDAADEPAARAAFLGGIAAAAAPLGMDDLVPADWTGFIDIPAARVNGLPGFADAPLPAADFLRADLDSFPIRDPDGTVTAWAINVAFSLRLDPTREGDLGGALTGWWRAGTATTRAISAAKLAAFPDASPPAVHERLVGPVVTHLLDAPPTFPVRVFAGLPG